MLRPSIVGNGKILPRMAASGDRRPPRRLRGIRSGIDDLALTLPVAAPRTRTSSPPADAAIAAWRTATPPAGTSPQFVERIASPCGYGAIPSIPQQESVMKKIYRQIGTQTLSALAGTAILLLTPAAAWAEESAALPKGFKTAPLLKGGKTADGDAIAYPRSDKPEIVSVVGTLEAGGRTALHQHPVPVFVYVMEGELEVQTEGKDVRRYKTGEAFLESIGRWHQAFNKTDKPVKLLVLFVGEEGKPTTQAKP
ncbi:cupin domain-containing protein [Azospira restricta]|nr:cupin domain-containing protein [Azospira restricta]